MMWAVNPVYWTIGPTQLDNKRSFEVTQAPLLVVVLSWAVVVYAMGGAAVRACCPPGPLGAVSKTY